jgi:hypothetical protein
MGRPGGINIKNIGVSRPVKGADGSGKKIEWSAYGRNKQFHQMGSYMDLQNPIEACTDANISLCEMMRRINKTLYVMSFDFWFLTMISTEKPRCAARHIPVDGLLKFASDVQKDLSTWLQSLPVELLVDTVSPQRLYLPHVLQLQYANRPHLVRILAVRVLF